MKPVELKIEIKIVDYPDGPFLTLKYEIDGKYSGLSGTYYTNKDMSDDIDYEIRLALDLFRED